LDRAFRENSLRIVLIGFGTVGQSLARVLTSDRDWLVRTYGFEPQVTAIVDSRGSCRDDNGLDLHLALKAKEKYGTVAKYERSGERKSSSSQVIANTEAEVVVETTPSNFKDGEPGLTNIKRSLSTRRHVVTANKGPLALAMPALLELADHMRMQLRFSATVGGGTPFLGFASKCLPGNRITGIHGILNGTTNYILTRMDEASLSSEEALAEAQAKGYAEKDPANDLQGLDTAAKIVIIGNWVLKRRLSIDELEITGIAKIRPETIRKARKSGTKVKLVGRLTNSDASVKPENLPDSDPVCIPGTLNALTFSTSHAGDVTLIGRGAGGEETASAIIRDLVDIRSTYSI
jgi:homoserine dehydrogenase